MNRRKTHSECGRLPCRGHVWNRRALVCAAAVLCALSGSWYLARGQSAPAAERADVDAKRAFGYLLKVCRLGPRPSGSRAMAEQQKLIADHFVGFGANVSFQTFDAAHPLSGMPVRMSNIVVSWHPDAMERVLIACHYDTLPFPDRDPVNPRGVFLGANDGASGVALLMELGHHMAGLDPAYGVDFVFFDGEEFLFGDSGRFFLGSEHFSQEYAAHSPGHRYVAGVLVDMVGDRNLAIYQEKNSVKLAPGVTRSVWDAARRTNAKEFIPRVRHEIMDDHLALNNIAKIPTCDVIDFDFPHWHTTRDIPAQCSGASLATVGRVLLEWLERPNLDGQ